jgi:hypothetical protein
VSRLHDRPAVAWAGVALLCGCAVLSGVLALFLVPLYAGSVLVPIAVVIAVSSNVALPRLARTLVQTTSAAVLPFACWLATVVIVGVLSRPEGDVVLPAGGGLQWVAYGVLLGGAVAGTMTVVMSGARRPAQAEEPGAVDLSR